MHKIFPHAFDSSLLDDESLPWLFPNMFEWCYSCDSKGFDHFEYRYITVCYQQNQKHLAVISQTFQRNTLAKERKAAPRNELKPDTGVDNRTRSN